MTGVFWGFCSSCLLIWEDGARLQPVLGSGQYKSLDLTTLPSTQLTDAAVCRRGLVTMTMLSGGDALHGRTSSTHSTLAQQRLCPRQLWRETQPCTSGAVRMHGPLGWAGEMGPLPAVSVFCGGRLCCRVWSYRRAAVCVAVRIL